MVFKNFAIFLFLIGATLAQERDSSTKLCNNEQGKVFFAKLGDCQTLAEQDFFLNFLNNDISKAACDFLSAKVNMVTWTSIRRQSSNFYYICWYGSLILLLKYELKYIAIKDEFQ